MRIRNIKPDFVRHEGLAELSRDHRYFFALLWMLCDPEGRTEDRPKRIASDLFPYDEDVTPQMVDEWLTDLHAKGFLVRYEVDGIRVVLVPNLPKHQAFSTWEKKKGSTLPAPTPEALQKYSCSHYAILPQSLLPDEGRRTKDEGHLTRDESRDAAEAAAPALRLIPPDAGKPKPKKRERPDSPDVAAVRAEVHRLTGIDYPPAAWDGLRARLDEYGLDDVLAYVRWAKSDDFLGARVRLKPSVLFRAGQCAEGIAAAKSKAPPPRIASVRTGSYRAEDAPADAFTGKGDITHEF